jgi:Fic family protein
MDFSAYHWEATPRIRQLLIELEAVKLVFDKTPHLPHLEENLRQKSLLKSAVFSARIENIASTESSPKKEGQNLVSAYRWVYTSGIVGELKLEIIRELHRLVLRGISSNPGQWRDESWAVFDQSGQVVHLAPAHFEVPELMNTYISHLNSMDENPGIKAAVAQFIFEKIHPFADGNGRVGRLISSYILHLNQYSFRGLAPFEEYIESHRDVYYSTLEPSHNITGFCEFFLEALVTKAQEIIGNIDPLRQETGQDALLPRRREILEIVKDHPHCSFDFIQRRFASVNGKTLHNDLLQLQKGSFIRKLGVSRGVVYIVSE